MSTRGVSFEKEDGAGDDEDRERGEQDVQAGAQTHENGGERRVEHGPNFTRPSGVGIVQKDDLPAHHLVRKGCAAEGWIGLAEWEE